MPSFALGLENLARPTIDLALEGLAADFTGQLPDAGFPIQLHRDRLLMVAEEASESRSQRLGLLCCERLATLKNTYH